MSNNPFPRGLAGLIYDCDGTMINSENANRNFYNLIMAYLGLPKLTPEQEKFAFMVTAVEALRTITPKELWPKLETATREALDYDKDVLPKVELMPGYREFCQFIRQKNLKQAIDTNRTEFGIRKILDFFELPNYFDPVVNSSIAEPKPSPQGALMVCEAWQARPEQILFVGDSDVDKETARNAGCVFAAFGKGDLEGEIKAETYAELTKIVTSILNQTTVH